MNEGARGETFIMSVILERCYLSRHLNEVNETATPRSGTSKPGRRNSRCKGLEVGISRHV